MALDSQKFDKLIRRLADCDLDQLHEVQTILNNRYRQIKVGARRSALATFKIGDEAELQNIKPKYMEGTRVIITGRNGTRFVVRTTGYVDPRGLARFGGSFKVPANCLKEAS